MKGRRAFIGGSWQRARGFSQAVVTEGGRIVWLAGHAALRDAAGRPLDGDFVGQARQTFRNLESSLADCGGALPDIVSLTIYLRNAEDWPRLVDIRKAVFQGDFPASAAVTISGLAHPELLIEIQAVALLG